MGIVVDRDIQFDVSFLSFSVFCLFVFFFVVVFFFGGGGRVQFARGT